MIDELYFVFVFFFYLFVIVGEFFDGYFEFDWVVFFIVFEVNYDWLFVAFAFFIRERYRVFD